MGKKYKLKKLGIDELNDTCGKVRTEDLFLRDEKLARMFVKYMLKNVRYLKRYEYDSEDYDYIIDELEKVMSIFNDVRGCFRKHQKKEGVL